MRGVSDLRSIRESTVGRREEEDCNMLSGELKMCGIALATKKAMSR